METNPKAKSKTDAPEQLREMAHKGVRTIQGSFLENERGLRASGRRYATLLFGGS